MFPQRDRLTREQFEVVLKEGKAVHTAHLSLRKAMKKGSNSSLFSVVVPKAVSKKAVVRNRVKRQGRALLKAYAKPTTPSLVALFIKKGADILTFAELEVEMLELLNKAKL